MSRPPAWWTSDEWATPPEVMRTLEQQFGRFDLDPCCRRATAKARHFYTQNGLDRPWPGQVFLNPPYSNVVPWLEKAIAETQAGRARLVVALLFVRTSTRWFHSLVRDRAEIQFLKGRVRFIGWQGTPIENPKDSSMLVIYRNTRLKPRGTSLKPVSTEAGRQIVRPIKR